MGFQLFGSRKLPPKWLGDMQRCDILLRGNQKSGKLTSSYVGYLPLFTKGFIHPNGGWP